MKHGEGHQNDFFFAFFVHIVEARMRANTQHTTSEILQYSVCGESNDYTNVKICNLCFFS